jgi:hypothetical protein
MMVVKDKDVLQNYWGQTGSLQSVRYVFIGSENDTLRNQLSSLLSGSSISIGNIRSDVVYRDLARCDPSTVWNLLFHAGYVTAIPDVQSNQQSSQQVMKHYIYVI